MRPEEIVQVEDMVRDLKRARDTNDLLAVHEIVRRAVASKPLLSASGEPLRIAVIHEESNLLVLQMVLEPGESVIPHEHGTWSVFGIYSGRAEYGLYRRIAGERRIELAGNLSLGARQVAILGHEAIHSVHNPLQEPAAALYVYGADLLGLELSQWAPPALVESRFRYDSDGRMIDLG
jgi:predicted metal-dependent enzyme (double-stranded beta helix superfamily)